MNHSPELTHFFNCWKLYNSLVDYWQRSNQEYQQHPGKDWLKNCQQTAEESEAKAAEYWRLFVEGVRESGTAVWYKENVGVMVER